MVAVTAAPADSAAAPAGRSRGPRPPAAAGAGGDRGGAADAAPAGLRRVRGRADRLGRGVPADLPAAHRRAALEHRPADRRLPSRCSLVLGVGAAWLVERTDLPGRRVWTVLLVAPLRGARVRQRYGWVSIAPGLDGYTGAVMIITLSYFPLVYLPVAAALRGLDPALEESRDALGLGPWATFFRVVLPQLRPGPARRRAAGRAAPAGRVRRVGDAALPDLHHRDLRPVPVDLQRPGGDACWPACWCCSAWRCCWPSSACAARPRYARVGGGAPRPVARAPARPARLAGAGRLPALVVLALGVPLGALVRWLLAGSSTGARHAPAAAGDRHVAQPGRGRGRR